MNSRLIKKRIKSVGSTRKITRTMELVSTAKAKRAQDRIKAAQPYALALSDLIVSATRGVENPETLHPLCAAREAKKVALFIVTANRGLCGGYNGNVFRLGIETRAKLLAEKKDVDVIMIGKKGTGYADFQKIPLAQRITSMDDRPSFQQAAEIIGPWMEKFLSGAVDRVLVCATHYASASRQFPRVEQILPVALPAEGDAGDTKTAPGPDFLWDPAPATLLGDLVPIAVKTNFLRLLMEATVSEQIARRIAMKSATENAADFIKSLTGTYNRVRQAQITQQIAEIVGGAEAIK